MTARKSVSDSLRKGLQQEDVALEARFTAAESVVSQLKAVGTSPQPPAAQPAQNRQKRKAQASGSSERVVRESLSMPASERATLDELITTLRKRGLYEVTRSQLLRAGIAQLAALQGPELERVVAAIERPRPGRK
jgi:hypothetical protein